MRTRTILSAFLTRRDELDDRYIIGSRRARLEIQVSKLYNELLRRMDERDALVAPKPPAFLTPERIGQYMAGFSDSMKADDILRGGK